MRTIASSKPALRSLNTWVRPCQRSRRRLRTGVGAGGEANGTTGMQAGWIVGALRETTLTGLLRWVERIAASPLSPTPESKKGATDAYSQVNDSFSHYALIEAA
jgi:hypothetical protein